jgi:protein TonB
MFSNTIHSSWDERSRRGLTTLTSFGLQALAVGVLLVLPLLRPMGLPMFRTLSAPVSLGQPLGEPPAPRMHASAHSAAPSDPANISWRQPAWLPSGIPPAGDDAPPAGTGFGPSISGSTVGDPHGVPDSPGNVARPIMPVAPAPLAAPIHISHMNPGDLVHKVLPTYPALARSVRIQGQVLLVAVISKQGAIENLRVMAGHPMLVPAAIEAVRQWRYRPYVLNNEPVEVETQITVNFSLGGN